MKSFVKLQPIKSMENIYALKKMYNLVEGNVSNLTSLGVPSDTYGKPLVHLLMEKMTHVLRLVISREFDDEVCELENMITYNISIKNSF